MEKGDRTPLVSVILSTYNGKSEWLKKAIDSVYMQSYHNFEFIIINDASTNNIEDTINEYIKKYDNIIYIKNEKNLGLTKSLNIGIKNSHGEYIARIDDDDYRISKDKLEKQVKFMEKNPEYGVCGAGRIVRVDEKNKILFTEYKNRLSDKQIRDHLLQHNQIVHSGVLIKKESLDIVGYYNISFRTSQDYELWCRIGTKYKLINLDGISIAYRLYPSAISIKNFGKQKKTSFKVFWKYRRSYTHFWKALILRCGAYILPQKFYKYIRRKLNPNLAVHEDCIQGNLKNILILNYEFPPIGGGGGKSSFILSKGYVDAGYNVDVITMGFKDLPRYENKEGINIYRVKCIRTKKEVCHPREQLTYLISGYFKAKKLLKEKKYNICHCQFLIPTGILALLIKRRYGINYIITARGSDVPGYNPNRFKLLHKFTPRLLKKIINNSEYVISPSKYLADLIQKNIKGINKNVEIIPNGIDTNEFIPLQKEKIVLGAGRLWPLKGLHLLAEAFSEIEDTKGFKLHICGDGPLMNKLKEIQNTSKNKIILHGWIDNKSKEYKNLFGKAMIFCLPSASENGPVSILEGMYSGCCVLTTDSTGCIEMTEGIGQYVKHNVESIKTQLEYLMNNPCICEELGKKARIKAINNYDKNVIIKRYIDLCKKYL